MRIFEKYSVKVGDGHNHRYNLSDGILLKDNHIGAKGGDNEDVTLCAGKALNKNGYISSEIYYCIQKVSQKSCGAFLLYIGRSYSFTSILHHCDYGFYCL